MKHLNNGACSKCLEIIYRYKDPHRDLVLWFMEFQRKHPEAHVAQAGRGRDEQEALYLTNRSRARFGQSAHNYNCAFDIFENGGDRKNIYETKWFYDVLAPNLPDFVTWYGLPGSKFFELPHIEVDDWRELAQAGVVKLVES